MKNSTLSLIWFLIGYSLAVSQTAPPARHYNYYSECWRGDGQYGNYGSDVWPDTGIFAISGPTYNEPANGYPMHSGIVKGVSDTITVIVRLYNRNESAYDISSYQVDNWFVPVLFDIKDDPHDTVVLADTSKFEYSFAYWKDWFLNLTSQPDTLTVSGGSGRYNLLFYYVWGLPFQGRVRLIMQKTANAPDGFKMLIDEVQGVWITKPLSIADTINAYMGCSQRASARGNNTAALSWTDSILALNSTSIPGYWARARVYEDLGDSLNTVASYDSLLVILNRYGDPVMPDSADQNYHQWWWYKEMIEVNLFHRWRYITGDKSYYQ